MMIEMVCFHTCNNHGSRQEILERAPFKSNSKHPPWLGEGYYFWTDSDYYAHEWGKMEPRNGDYVIVKAVLNIQEEDFLDLVGNVEHQLRFNQLIEDYKNYLKKLIETPRNSEEAEQLTELLQSLSVSSVIQFYRNRNIFDYKVVKAQDMPNKKGKNSTPFVISRKESLLIPTRQQLVVYEESKSCIRSVKWYYPN